jgi:hypothetical protein
MAQGSLILPGLNQEPGDWADSPCLFPNGEFHQEKTHPWMFWEEATFLTFL